MRRFILLLLPFLFTNAYGLDAWEIIKIQDTNEEDIELEHLAIKGEREVYVAGNKSSDGIFLWDDGVISKHIPNQGDTIMDMIYADDYLWVILDSELYSFDGNYFIATGISADRLFKFESSGLWVVAENELLYWNGTAFDSKHVDENGIEELLAISEDEFWYTETQYIAPGRNIVHVDGESISKFDGEDISPSNLFLASPKLVGLESGVLVTSENNSCFLFDGSDWINYPVENGEYDQPYIIAAAHEDEDVAWFIIDGQGFGEKRYLQRFDLEQGPVNHEPLLKKVDWMSLKLEYGMVYSIGLEGTLLIGNEGIKPIEQEEALDANEFYAVLRADGSHQRRLKEEFLPNFLLGEDSVSVLYELSPLVAVKDNMGELRASGGRYISDFIPGNTSEGYLYRSPIIKITKSQVDQHKLSFEDEGYVIPEAILNWPANGLTSRGEPLDIARFHDENDNGYYDPENGDYPIIRGDQAVLFICNDEISPMLLTSGEPTGVEIIGLAYVYDDPSNDALQQSVFFHYELINRNQFALDSVRFGLFMEMSVGGTNDDYSGSASEHDIAYIYNGDNDDDGAWGNPGFGNNPPAVGIKFLSEELDVSLSPISSSGPAGNNINTDSDIWNLLNARWKDGVPVTSGGNGYDPLSTNYATHMYDGDPITNTGWTEQSSFYLPGQRRLISAFPMFSLEAGARKSFDFVLGVGRAINGNNLLNINELFDSLNDLESFYDEEDFEEGVVSTERAPLFIRGSENSRRASVEIYPNPSNGTFQLDGLTQIDRVVIYNSLGQQVQYQRSGQSIKVSDDVSGHLFLHVQRENSKDQFLKTSVR